MRRLMSVLLSVFIIVISLSACDGHRNSIISSGRFDLYAVANFSVPFVVGSLDWDKLEVIEKDSYGRVMFKYHSISSMMNDYCGKDLYALVICQKYDKEYSYYYDNYDFLYLKNQGSISSTDCETLKSLNDWNKPINELKLSKVKNTVSHGWDVQSYTKNSILQYLPKNGELDYCFDGISIDDYDRYLYVIREYKAVREFKESEKEYTFYDSYLAICDENNNVLTENGEPCILKIKDIVHCQDDMKTIKERSNWNKPR